MQGLSDEVPRHVLRIQMRLFACRERLRVTTDGEALHDLRIALRQLRSLLRPLSSVAACEALQLRAAELGRLTGPLRDLEVLQDYLQQQGLDSAAKSRLPLLQQGYLQLLDCAPLAHLLTALDDWPWQWRQAASNGQLRGLDKLIKQRLRKDRKRLKQALLDPAHDRHRLPIRRWPVFPVVCACSLSRRSQHWVIGMTTGNGCSAPKPKQICNRA